MPLVRVDVAGSWSEPELAELLDQLHRAVVESFAVPERDRYQILQVHPTGRMVLQDSGLGFERSERAVAVQVTSRARATEAKLHFYRRACDLLGTSLGLAPTDLVVTVVENGDADWSFAGGEAEFVTGALA
jgi:hypothetical protein